MPGYVLHVGASVGCAHPPGAAQPAGANPGARVRVGGQAAVVMNEVYRVSGCPFQVGGGASPCVTAVWTRAALRVKSMGQPLVLTDSQSTSVPNETPLSPKVSQTRVKAS